MQDYKANLEAWARYAIDHDQADWSIEQEKLTKDELLEMLNILAGYFGATPQGKKLLESWI